MPVFNRTNNRVIPANSRAADVAHKTLQEIIPAQQRRYSAAFRVMGVPCIVYHYLKQGERCSCQSGARILNSRLNKDGKASTGAINELITGDSFAFGVYGSDVLETSESKKRDFGIDTSGDNIDSMFSKHNITSPEDPHWPYQGTVDIVRNSNRGHQELNATNNARIEDEEAYGDNGRVLPETIDDLVGQFDPSTVGFTDVACPVCFGSGFVGGYSIYRGWRKVLAASESNLELGPLATFDLHTKPWTIDTGDDAFVKFHVVLPKGAISVDSIRLWDTYKPVPFRLSIDNESVQTPRDFLKRCDGREHVLHVQLLQGKRRFTHFELQVNLAKDVVYFDFPRLSKSSDLSLLERTQPFQIVFPPDLPYIESHDVIVDQTYGKFLVVQDVNTWNDQRRQVLGWECNVRPTQPAELYNSLPKRPVANQPSGLQIRDNVDGPRRT